MKRTFIFTILIFVCVFIFACKKQTSGPKGETGISGSNGNAQQVYTKVFTLPFQNWIRLENKKDWNTTIYNDLITDQVLERGSIDVAVQIDGAWRRLPYSKSDYFLQASIKTNYIYLNYSKLHGLTKDPESWNFKVIIVSPK